MLHWFLVPPHDSSNERASTLQLDCCVALQTALSSTKAHATRGRSCRISPSTVEIYTLVDMYDTLVCTRGKGKQCWATRCFNRRFGGPRTFSAQHRRTTEILAGPACPS